MDTNYTSFSDRRRYTERDLEIAERITKIEQIVEIVRENTDKNQDRLEELLKILNDSNGISGLMRAVVSNYKIVLIVVALATGSGKLIEKLINWIP